MKQLLLIPALLLGSAIFAQDYKYELSPMIGYNIAEGNLDMKNDGYFTGGIEFQINSDSQIAPEFSLYFAPNADYKTTGNTNVIRGAFNGVYTFDTMDNIIPFAKAGVGIENFTNNQSGNKDGFFVDAGAGLKVPFSEQLAFKAEALYMAKIGREHAGNADSNLMALIGLTYSFGATSQKVVEQSVVKEEVVVVAVDGDDDNDGIPNSKDSCNYTPANTPVGALGCALPQDSDHDGINDAQDKCPNTPKGTQVDATGCDRDMDHDGVVNADDICPNTPLGSAVNSDGCPASIDLHINFENNSYKVKKESFDNIYNYADFLKKYTNYSAKIVGYTDSIGSAAYNQKLSEKRANEVQRMLIESGVNPAQLSAEGRGEANPVASNKTAQGRAQNRRIEAELTRD